MDRVFLDANVLFSAAYRSESRLSALWRLPETQLVTSDYAVREAQRNLPRDDQHRRLTTLFRSCEVIPTPSAALLPARVVLPDGDRPILLAAMTGKATHLLTGDKTHFGRYYGETVAGVLILPPAAYLHHRQRSRRG